MLPFRRGQMDAITFKFCLEESSKALFLFCKLMEDLWWRRSLAPCLSVLVVVRMPPKGDDGTTASELVLLVIPPKACLYLLRILLLAFLLLSTFTHCTATANPNGVVGRIVVVGPRLSTTGSRHLLLLIFNLSNSSVELLLLITIRLLMLPPRQGSSRHSSRCCGLHP